MELAKRAFPFLRRCAARHPARGASASLVLTALVASAALAAGCSRVPDEMRIVGDVDAAAPAQPALRPELPGNGQAKPAGKIRLIEAPAAQDSVKELVRAQIAKSKADGRALIVYVGATWCEPCQNFHAAVAKGELDSAFPKLDILAFDQDRDKERLVVAGYTSRYIPLFALPKDDGTMSDRMFEGSVKGNGAITDITPKLKRLIGS